MAVILHKPRRPAARLHGDLLMPTSTRADLHHRRHRADGRSQAPSAYRLDPHGSRSRQARCATTSKWDYQPTSIDGVPESFARAYSVMMTEPKGPIYMCYDAALQRRRRPTTCRCRRSMPSPRRRRWRPTRAPSRPSPTSCSRPSIRCCCRICRRRAGGFESIVALAEWTASRGGTSTTRSTSRQSTRFVSAWTRSR